MPTLVSYRPAIIADGLSRISLAQSRYEYQLEQHAQAKSHYEHFVFNACGCICPCLYLMGKVLDGYERPYGLHHWWLDCDEPCGGGNGEGLTYRNEPNEKLAPRVVTVPQRDAARGGRRRRVPALLIPRRGGGAGGRRAGERHAQLNSNGVKEVKSEAVLRQPSSQRFGGAVWSGDTRSDFANLRQQFAAGLNMALSGITYWTTDIGGYCNNPPVLSETGTKS
eukprot:gene13836-biopygen11687